ncbi:hypothetical protein [Fictibacillus nanhaiensis]|uniref:hypothetical protein n=1 Tax=Fictibacillus nanhaiensis TaxID=742169 RepID=UPI003C1F4F43
MNKIVGIFIIVQVILTGLILNGLQAISNSILISAVHQKRGLNTISWSDNLSTVTYVVLALIVLIGFYLILLKEKSNGLD